MFQFDFNQLWQDENYGVFISGAPGSGKTNLAFLLTDVLVRNNIIVYVFDLSGSQIWKTKSSVPNYEEITKRPFFVFQKRSTIYDISLLPPARQQRFVENFCRVLFNERARNRYSRIPTFLIFEEAQNYIPDPIQPLPTGLSTEHVRNIIHVGRNVKLRFALLTQFPSSIDRREIKYCRLRFFGHCEDPEDIEYLRPLIKEKADLLCDLKTGQFIYYHGRYCRRVKTKLFKR